MQLAESAARLEAAQQAAAWRSQAQEHLEAVFKALAADLLQVDAQQFLGQASTQLTQVIDPLKSTLGALEQQVRHLETQRECTGPGSLDTLSVSLIMLPPPVGRARRPPVACCAHDAQ
jgi:DNA anti-recombination protein RmuC